MEHTQETVSHSDTIHDKQAVPSQTPASRSNSMSGAQGWYGKHVLVSVVFGVIFGFLGGIAALSVFPSWQKTHLPLLGESRLPGKNVQETAMEDSAVIHTVDQASPAVVSVVITKDIPRLRNIPHNFFGFPFFFNLPEDEGSQGPNETEKQTVGQGSGFLVSADGLIVTNKHVVSDEKADYTVILKDGKEYVAKVLARDPVRDIALLKIEAQALPFLELGDSEKVQVGQTAIAIGNSLGEFSNTVSKGIVSGVGRNLVAGSGSGDEERLSNIIQTDAAINPGNSGGPLLDIFGKVVGVNVAIAQGAQNIGFALPANQVKKIIDQVQSTGKISTPFLGIRYVMLTAEIQKENNLLLDHGALIARGEKMTDFAVIPGSPADKAGLMENDIVLEINGVALDKDHQISDIVSEHTVGDTLTLKVWHKGSTKDVTIVLEERK